MDSRERVILVVEDSPEDFEAMRRGFKKCGTTSRIVHCVDGEDALDYLYRRGAYADAADVKRPAIVLLDLNMPGIDGRDVLRTLKSDPTLRAIPVVVLTTSRDYKDIQQCYTEGANSYIQKPLLLDDLVIALTRLSEFWFDTAQLPEELP